MARKENIRSNSPRGIPETVAILLISLSLLLLVAMFSYDRNDLRINHEPPNDPTQNWIGPAGAWIAYSVFFVFGAAGYLIPVLMIGYGASCFVGSMAYLRRCWPWVIVFMLSCMGTLDLYSDHFQSLKDNLNAGSPGGFLGMLLGRVFGYFGQIGATIIFATLYLISLLFLTNFQLTDWLRRIRMPRLRPFNLNKPSDEEIALQKKARQLEKQSRKLERAVGRSKASSPPTNGSGTDADLEDDAEEEAIEPEPEPEAEPEPEPEPTVRDMSISVARAPAKKAGGKDRKQSEPDDDQVGTGETITADEVPAATTAELLGGNGKDAAPDKQEEGGPAPARLPAPRPGYGRRIQPIRVASTPKINDYRLPDLEHLHHQDPQTRPTDSKETLVANARLMQTTLRQFGIEVALGDITRGPTITRYELHPAPGVRLERITALTNNITAALKAERIHILAPVPGKSSVGVEVPNQVKTKVIMRDLLESDEWRNSKMRIPLALGKDVYGHPIMADLAEMPHLLIAGSTGSGKSVCINSIIASLLYRFSPEHLRFVMIDPKVVELQQYNALPHLVVPVVNDPKKVILALRWVVNEMEKRYQIFAKVGVRNIKGFNERPAEKPRQPPEPELPLNEGADANEEGFAVELDKEIVVPREDDIIIPESLSYIVVIIDELADLMLVAPADVEMAIARITQMARAAGIHCIIATQRPSVDVITGVIKANIPARIAFQVAAKVDSRTILDAMGADKLLGKGDMLYLPPGSAKLIRAQGVLITDEEIQSIVDTIAAQGKPSYETEIHEKLQKPASSFEPETGASGEDEDLIQQCIEVIRSEQKASVSLMQRRLRLGYTRAARIMDELEQRGIVGPSKGAEPRDILIDLDGTGADGAGQ